MKKLLLGLTALVAVVSNALAAPTNEVLSQDNIQLVNVGELSGETTVHVEVISAALDDPYSIGWYWDEAEFGIYKYEPNIQFPTGVETLAIIDKTNVGDVASFVIDPTTQVATNDKGQELNVGTQFGWYLRSQNTVWYLYSEDQLNWDQYKHVQIGFSDDGTTAFLRWESDVHNPFDPLWDDLVIGIGFATVTVPVPAAGTFGLLLIGGLGLVAVRRRK